MQELMLASWEIPSTGRQLGEAGRASQEMRALLYLQMASAREKGMGWLKVSILPPQSC